MFLGILSWMIAHVPGVMRPAVNWLVDGLRKITGHIAALWNTLGNAVGAMFNAVAVFRAFVVGFAVAVANGIWWVKNVYIPARLHALQASIITVLNQALALVHNTLLAIIRGVERWVSDRLRELGEFVGGIYAWALDQFAKLGSTLGALINALRHVMSGPAALAEWLVGEMWRAFLRQLSANRDRIFQWMFTQSVSFTNWLARQIEDMIVRLL
jgi:hypothetical protein